MEPVSIRSLVYSSPLINSSCPWASSRSDLNALFENAFTGGVTTRTATLHGFPEDESTHRVVFTQQATLNSYGYSPYPLSTYVDWAKGLLLSSGPSTKPIVISITSSKPQELEAMVACIQHMRAQVGDVQGHCSRIGIELNTSCPNIPSSPPPAYEPSTLMPLLHVLASAVKADHTLTVGIKLPPYVYSAQFDAILDTVSQLDQRGENDSDVWNPIAFFTCTNTLGGCLFSGEQVGEDADWALNGYGGMGGSSIHSLSLGNVHRFSTALSNHPSAALRKIVIIGVGGVQDVQGVKRMLKAGARIVAVATALGRKGVRIFEELKFSEA